MFHVVRDGKGLNLDIKKAVEDVKVNCNILFHFLFYIEPWFTGMQEIEFKHHKLDWLHLSKKILNPYSQKTPFSILKRDLLLT
jgi:hypothetical protein